MVHGVLVTACSKYLIPGLFFFFVGHGLCGRIFLEFLTGALLLLLLQLQAFVLQTNPFCAVITAPQRHLIVAQFAQQFPSARIITGLHFFPHFAGGHDVLPDDPGAQFIRQRALGGIAQLLPYLDDALRFSQGKLLCLPIPVAAEFPLGKVPGIDRGIVEVLRKRGFDFFE